MEFQYFIPQTENDFLIYSVLELCLCAIGSYINSEDSTCKEGLIH